MARAVQPPESCALCGADIPANAKSCPDCGADERTGWREPSVYDGLDLPDEAWNDDSAGERASLPIGGRSRDGTLAWYWWATALLIFLVFVFAVLGLR